MSNNEKESNKDVIKKSEARRMATIKQIDFLIDFLRDNEELRSGRVRSKEVSYIVRQLWDLCTEKLNKLGPSRNSKEWAKYWSDLKCRARQKVVEINKRSSNAGEGSSAGPGLTYVEKRIVKLLELDGQIKNTKDAPFDLSVGSSLESMGFTLIKEEKEDMSTQDLEMNVEDFITTVPVVDIVASPSDKLPPLQPATNQSRPVSASLPGAPLSTLQTPLMTPKPAAEGPQQPQANMQLSPINREPTLNRPRSVPSGVSTTPKRRRRRARVIQPRPSRSCVNPECINCIELKEFCDVMLKLEESHAKTTKLQTEASLKMTEVLKLQAEGILHTGVALREMASNLCRLFEGQMFSNRQIAI